MEVPVADVAVSITQRKPFITKAGLLTADTVPEERAIKK